MFLSRSLKVYRSLLTEFPLSIEALHGIGEIELLNLERATHSLIELKGDDRVEKRERLEKKVEEVGEVWRKIVPLSKNDGLVFSQLGWTRFLSALLLRQKEEASNLSGCENGNVPFSEDVKKRLNQSCQLLEKAKLLIPDDARVSFRLARFFFSFFLFILLF